MLENRTPPWKADRELAGFEELTFRFPDDYDGPVVATLVRRRAPAPSRKAFLFVHGWNDYFFQEHLADRCNLHGYNFYALDLRKYGRSLLPGQHPAFCKDMREYFSDLTAAITVITGDEGNDSLVLGGHSTGGLLVTLYAHSGGLCSRVSALWLNSPFFDFNLKPNEKALLPLIALVGKFFPFGSRSGFTTAYGESLHRNYHGEWEYNLTVKPSNPFPAYYGWIRAVLMAQARVHRGLDLACPILLMHSDKSIYGKDWRPDFQTGDAVLNVADMHAEVPNLGPDVTEIEIKDGLHDLVLSRLDVRDQVFSELFAWLSKVQRETGAVQAAEVSSEL